MVAEFETIYGDMPPAGLAKALGSRPVGPGTEGGRRRLGLGRRSAA